MQQLFPNLKLFPNQRQLFEFAWCLFLPAFQIKKKCLNLLGVYISLVSKLKRNALTCQVLISALLSKQREVFMSIVFPNQRGMFELARCIFVSCFQTKEECLNLPDVYLCFVSKSQRNVWTCQLHICVLFQNQRGMFELARYLFVPCCRSSLCLSYMSRTWATSSWEGGRRSRPSLQHPSPSSATTWWVHPHIITKVCYNRVSTSRPHHQALLQHEEYIQTSSPSSATTWWVHPDLIINVCYNMVSTSRSHHQALLQHGEYIQTSLPSAVTTWWVHPDLII